MINKVVFLDVLLGKGKEGMPGLELIETETVVSYFQTPWQC